MEIMSDNDNTPLYQETLVGFQKESILKEKLELK
jgi:hypothetical protein